MNTGNIDAFVRMWLTGEMKVLNTTPLLDTNATYYDSFPTNPKASLTTDGNLTALILSSIATERNI